MKVKVCGMKYQDNIEDVSHLQPDYLGFIFYEKSPRYFNGVVTHQFKNTKNIGVFVNVSLAYLKDKIKTHNLQVVQLHGIESPEYCKNIQKLGVEIIKVFSIKDCFNFDQLKPYESVCDYYLFDTKGRLPGGNGYTFDWSLLKSYPSTKPYFLSGGIGLDELENIKQFQKSSASKYCHAIDVNSKFETQPGLKCIKDLKTFINEL